MELTDIGLFHLISIHPPRKSVNYVGGVNNGQKLMCPRGSSSNHKLCPGGFELKPILCPRGSWTNHIRCPGESGTEKMCISPAQITNCVQGGLG